MNSRKATFLPALALTVLSLSLGYFSFGPWTAFIFSFGFLGGFFLWWAIPSRASLDDIRKPFWITFAAFIFLHRVEEYAFKFQEELAKITGHPVPDVRSPILIALVLVSVGGWLSVPFLIKRKVEFGYFLAWSFFASMGITELAHFVFPFLTSGRFGYFPGMASVFILAPLAWWGMFRLKRRENKILEVALGFSPR